MFIPIFTLSPLIFIIGFTFFSKVKKKDEPETRVTSPVGQLGRGLDFELLFFTSSLDSALILREKRQAPTVNGAGKTKTGSSGERVGIWS